MTCTQNHKDPKKCIQCLDEIIRKELKSNAVIHTFPDQYYKDNLDCMFYGCKPSVHDKSKFAWKESYQWLKIIGLSIALGIMVYQTWLLYKISTG